MRQALVLSNNIVAGRLIETDERRYIFRYDEDYLFNSELRAISLAFPKRKEEYVSDELFPFFFNMLSEGSNKALQCRTLKIDENDSFGLLLATAKYDTIGAITIQEL
ncbi:MAG: HipA N-terminal domain-containing protein [Bacteroidales bacterium]|jgi:serine/threonine-protein kinase HipA|nr:HipA N-terminal domain-containing protein [Bacteroidales bacterium]MBQ5873447.1 HipA N-terminal domain-containing protein [Bacteroidales bacterium]MBQ5892609.1 HipA N-terminal domain-containing protein [Bacteroidales bacterium]MBR5254726.1 HipA N-terminal domain-containing protein [Bacteroidales bacterium]MEE1271252.1 HipA N-terminal domain-containing protein [Bacteroidales bacterium]